MARLTSAKTEDIALGYPPEGAVGRAVFQVIDGGGWSGALTPKARVPGAAVDGEAAVSVPYINRLTGAAVAAGTPIAGEGIFEVNTTGLELFLSHAWTAGTVIVRNENVSG